MSLQWSDDGGLTWHNESVPAQSNLLFRAKVGNAGTAAFPAPKPIRVDFEVNGSLVAWSDTYRSGLTKGASKLLVANTGPDGDALWYDAPAGTHTVVARVDPLNSYTELKERNNTRSATLTVDPLPNSPEVSADLPFFGQYYGAAPFGQVPGNSNTNNCPIEGFFFAHRTGTVTHFRYHARYGSGYSSGNGGTHTVSIYPADPATKRRVAGSAAICQATGIAPGNPGPGFKHFVVAFSITGQLIAKQPYVIHWQNTHANPGSNFFGLNQIWQWGHNNGVTEPPPTGTDPRNVSNTPVACSGWSPVWIDGEKEMFAWPDVHRNGTSRYHGQLLFGIRYSDGIWAGGDHFASEQNYNYKLAITPSSWGRVRFRVSRATRVVNGVYVRVTRKNACRSNLIVTLESGPTADLSGNGTTIEQVSVPSPVLFDVGAEEKGGNPDGKATWVWVPFTQHRTLTLGQLYNLRLHGASGFDGIIWCHNRADSYYSGHPKPRDVTWDQWEAQRQIDWTAWEDSRGFQKSTNSGSSWAWHRGRAPILFKCVT
jgi:hypothetical protein